MAAACHLNEATQPKHHSDSLTCMAFAEGSGVRVTSSTGAEAASVAPFASFASLASLSSLTCTSISVLIAEAAASSTEITGSECNLAGNRLAEASEVRDEGDELCMLVSHEYARVRGAGSMSTSCQVMRWKMLTWGKIKRLP